MKGSRYEEPGKDPKEMSVSRTADICVRGVWTEVSLK